VVSQDYIFPSYFVLVMFASAFNAKFLGVCIVAALALVAVYPNWTFGGFVFLFFVPALLIAGTRG
jgi:hypothetical protein